MEYWDFFPEFFEEYISRSYSYWYFFFPLAVAAMSESAAGWSVNLRFSRVPIHASCRTCLRSSYNDPASILMQHLFPSLIVVFVAFRLRVVVLSLVLSLVLLSPSHFLVATSRLSFTSSVRKHHRCIRLQMPILVGQYPFIHCSQTLAGSSR